MEQNGNDFTKILHLITLHELHKMHARNILPVKKIVPEQNVLLCNLHGSSEREGRFDFLVLARDGKTLGFEVLSRPTHGKLKEKLSYAREVDEFVFVLPKESMVFYRKRQKKPFKAFAREKFVCNDFAETRIKAWLADAKNGLIEEKGAFCELFNVSQNGKHIK